MNIAVVGTGYVGLVTGTCFAENGNSVICVDIDENKVERMRKGQVPIYEPGLEEIFDRNTKDGRLSFTTDLAKAVKHADIIFLALPTPPGEDGSADLSYILKAASDIGPLLDKYTIVINKSTVPVGTAEKVHAALAEKAAAEFEVVSNPEFLKEGFAVEDFMHPDRVVIGTDSQKARDILDNLYAPFVHDGGEILFMDTKSSEMTKYAANAFLATKITFMNEVANVCERVGANVDHVRRGVGSDARIGNKFLFPGIGYGGSCFPKDVRALKKTAEENGYDFSILESVTTVNNKQKHRLFEKLVDRYTLKGLKGKKFALWGLAFKQNTDDIREAPALCLIDDLLEAGAQIVAYDPEAANNVRKKYQGIKGLKIVDDDIEALKDADALLIATEWDMFRTPDFTMIKNKLKELAIFDGRNLYDLEKMRGLGFEYISIGRAKV
jgi:UDPglucose 6-dehydrogenase